MHTTVLGCAFLNPQHIVQLKRFGNGGSQTRAHLKRSSLLANGAASQNRHASGEKDARRQQSSHRPTVPHARNHRFGGLPQRDAEHLVEEQLEQSGHRQQPDQPGVAHEDTTHGIDEQAEQNRPETSGHATHHGEQQMLE